MEIMFIGDVVGSIGREMIEEYLPLLKRKYRPHLTIVNGENAAGGRGITEPIYKRFLDWGANVVTLGNHVWDHKEVFDFIDDAKYLVRPANFPEGTPGEGMIFYNLNQTEIAVINLQGRTFMPPLDCPFTKVDQLIHMAKERTNIIFIDFHAEATSEKQAMGWYVDGKVTAVIGTHTHVQTADYRILSEGTAYMTDAGMTGAYDGILGMEKEAIIYRFLSALPSRFEVPRKGRKQLSGCLITVDDKTGLAQNISPILINDDHPFLI